MRLGGLEPDTLIKILKWLVWPLIAIYALSMFVVPFVQIGGSWHDMQEVWVRWQGVNVGMLALFSSAIAFSISRYKAEQERGRNFVAARAFLPAEFSELTSYCRASMAIFAEAYQRAKDPNDTCRTPLEASFPSLPDGHREVFRDCIRFAEPEIGDFLARILERLQIHHSRMRGLDEDFRPDGTMVIIPQNVISYLDGIAEIQALINSNFNYARGRDNFDCSPLEWENYRNALSLGGIQIGDYDDLQGFIERHIARGQQGE